MDERMYLAWIRTATAGLAVGAALAPRFEPVIGLVALLLASIVSCAYDYLDCRVAAEHER